MASVLRKEWIRAAAEEGLQALAERRFFFKQKPICPTCQCLEIGKGVRSPDALARLWSCCFA